MELRCRGDHVPAERIVAKVMYPNGTDKDFMPTWCKTWEDAEALAHDGKIR